MIKKRNILTIATGKDIYIEMAANLARSFYWWNKDSGIKFYIVTDNCKVLPKDIIPYISIIQIKRGELGEGFTPKLYLDQLSPDGQTLFIDSDCLIFGNIESVFERFNGHQVSVVGNYISTGEWFGDIAKICLQFNVPHLPKFNGGIYYIEKGPIASSVYSKARDLEKKYDEIGFVRLRNRPNDEVIMALAMQLHNMKPLIDDSTIMSDPQACSGGYKIDVINGKCNLLNPPAPHPLHRNWYPFENVSPLVFHFLGYYTQHYPYKREAYRLKTALKNKLNWRRELYVLLKIEWPERIKNGFKEQFRPIYRLLFGTRKIIQSQRI